MSTSMIERVRNGGTCDVSNFQDLFDLETSIILLVSQMPSGLGLQCTIESNEDFRFYFEVFRRVNINYPCRVKISHQPNLFTFIRK